MSFAEVLARCENEEEEGAWEHAFEQMAWARPQNTIQEINAAGKILGRAVNEDAEMIDDDGFEKWLQAYTILNNWRSAHRYPLNIFQNNLRKSARRIRLEPLVASRIKRLFSITAKLRRLPNMKLSQMQDIGGCRAVLGSNVEVNDLTRFYEGQSKIKHPLSSKDDYISEPQKSGYRGVHFVYRYYSDKGYTTIYNGMKIEMQLRTQVQHAWATAVETVGTFVGQALKSSMGDEDWRRFFALMSTSIALRENTPHVPDTTENRTELRDELRELANKLNVQNRLQTYGRALQAVRQREEKAQYYLLELDAATTRLTISSFKMEEMEEAELRYQQVEKMTRDNPERDAVLVSVDSLSALERAFPNYFADTRVFVQLLKQELSGHRRNIHMPELKIESS